ncbi:MAG: NAD(P)-dependent oxidoreductase [Verrucomicrobiota bacterium]
MNLSLLGLGIIGSLWARHHAADGRALRTWNRSPKPEAPGFTPDIAQAVHGVDILHLCVGDIAAVESVLKQALPHLQPGALVIQSSTISPEAASHFRQETEAHGGRYLEAPFTGSGPIAEQRQTVFYVGGPEALIEEALPALAPLSRTLHRLPDERQAQAVKLSMNLQVAAITQALAEGLQLARQHGLRDDDFFKILRDNASHTKLADLKEPKLRQQDFSPQFSVKHMHKDLTLAQQAAGELPLLQLARTLEVYQLGLEAGYAEEDFSSLIRLVKP